RRLVEAVWELWRTELAQMQAAEFATGLEEALAAGLVFLVFDGLDEVPERVRERVRLAVNAILRTYPAGNRVIVTCRIRSYSGQALLPGFQAETLAPFDRDKIRAFIRAWYQAQS